MGTDAARCRLVREADGYEGRQGLTYTGGISTQSAGARGLCMHLLTIPPGGRAKAHLHRDHESAIHLISGSVEVFHGDGLCERTTMDAGDFFYIPAGVPHLPVNASATRPARAVIARTDPNEQESVVLLPDLDARVDPTVPAPLQARAASGSAGPTQGAIPMLAYADGSAALDWLHRAFGFEETARFVDNGRLTHGEMDTGHGSIMLASPSPDYEGPAAHREHCERARAWSSVPWIVDGVLVLVDDVDAHHRRALAAGAVVLTPPEDGSPGRRYRTEDLEGHRWMFLEKGR